MLNEPASSIDDRPAARSSVRYPNQLSGETSPLHDQIRQMVMKVFMIEREMFARDDDDSERNMRSPMLMLPDGRLTAAFEGRLLIDSEAAYAQLDEAFKPINHIPLFRVENGKQIIYAVSGRVVVRPRPIWLNVVLFIATVISVLMLGTIQAINEIADGSEAIAQPYIDNFWLELWRGLPYAVCILLILGAHELGHYFAARRHKLAVTPPYFIPLPPLLVPTPIGTMGAFIQLREPMRNRKVLFDVGASGPFIGLIFAVPILIIGLATSQVNTVTPGGLVEGNSLLYAGIKTIVFGRFLPSGGQDVFLNQVAWAGWVGLLVTALNLMPVGQLDGGHILYSLIGERARLLYYPVLIAMTVLTFTVSDSWVFWLALLLIFGRMYAAPLDMITPLDRRRRALAVIGLLVFVITFVPIPFSYVGEGADPTPRQSAFMAAQWLLPLSALLMAAWTRRRAR